MRTNLLSLALALAVCLGLMLSTLAVSLRLVPPSEDSGRCLPGQDPVPSAAK